MKRELIGRFIVFGVAFLAFFAASFLKITQGTDNQPSRSTGSTRLHQLHSGILVTFKKQTLKGIIYIETVALPVQVKFNLLQGHSYRLTTRHISLRLPVTASENMVREHLDKLQQWVSDQFDKQPVYREAFLGKQYRSGDVVQVGERRYILTITFKDRVTNSAHLVGDAVFLELNHRLNPWQQSRIIKTLLSRIVAKDFYPEIVKRVLAINERTFRQPIRSINLKYNHSNWGSCSHASNVNLSTRLLFAPKEVQDYVILHELAHLVEMNHSDRFWALVEKHMPHYREAEKWLKANRAKCDF